MIVVEKKPVPIYEMECYECKSRLRYKAAEVSMCRVVCPVCGVPLWVATVSPVGYEPSCAGCRYWDGDDGRCRNPNSRRYMMETEDGCEMREGYDGSD